MVATSIIKHDGTQVDLRREDDPEGFALKVVHFGLLGITICKIFEGERVYPGRPFLGTFCDTNVSVHPGCDQIGFWYFRGEVRLESCKYHYNTNTETDRSDQRLFFKLFGGLGLAIGQGSAMRAPPFPSPPPEPARQSSRDNWHRAYDSQTRTV